MKSLIREPTGKKTTPTHQSHQISSAFELNKRRILFLAVLIPNLPQQVASSTCSANSCFLCQVQIQLHNRGRKTIQKNFFFAFRSKFSELFVFIVEQIVILMSVCYSFRQKERQILFLFTREFFFFFWALLGLDFSASAIFFARVDGARTLAVSGTGAKPLSNSNSCVDASARKPEKYRFNLQLLFVNRASIHFRSVNITFQQENKEKPKNFYTNASVLARSHSTDALGPRVIKFVLSPC